MSKDEEFICLRCGCFDPDSGECTVPSWEKVYACPLYDKKEKEDDE